MKDQDKTKAQLISELEELRGRVAATEGVLLEHKAATDLLQIAPLGIHECDTEGRVTFVNPSQEAITGYPAEELLGTFVWDRIPPGPDRESLAAYFSYLVSEQPPPTPYVNKNIRKNGEVFDVRIDWSYKRNLQGQLTGFVCIVTDITEQKQAEEALRKAHDELEERVRERTADLAGTNAAMQREVEERKRIQEALRHSHDELQAIYDNMVDGLLIGDCSTGKLVRTNPAICQMLGYSADEMLAMTVRDIHPPEVVPSVLEKFRTQREGERLITQNRPMLRKDGTVFYADVSNVRILYQGQPCMIGIFRDVTERKQAEAALRVSEERYELAVRGAGVGIFDWNILAGKVYYSPRWKALLGYEETEIGDGVEDWSTRLHPDERESIIKQQDDFFAGTSPTAVAEYRLRHKDGSYRWIEANVLVVRDEKGRACRLVGSHADITERKQAEEAIKESEEKLRTLFQILPVGVSLLNEQSQVVDLNPALKQILGMTREGLFKGDYTRRRYLRSDGSPMSPEEYPSARATRDGAEVSDVEIGVVKEDGTTTWVSVSAAPLPVRGLGAAVVTMDITERRQALEALKRERQSLWHMLQASDHERQTISYEIHDGLSQYLAAAGMQFQAHEFLREHSPEEAKKAYETAVELVRQAHIESRRLISEVRPPVIDEIGLETAISHLVYDQRRPGGPSIKFDSEVRFGRLPVILENSLYRIAQEALTNACKHSKSKKVTVTLAQDNQEVRLEVKDWGIGFDLESVEKGHFGLEGIRQRVRLLGGRLKIESKLGSGSFVQAVVPIVERLNEG